MRHLLKAQQQCANTVKVVGELKAPKSIAFIKQQNNAAGRQQVNNGTAPPMASCAHEEHPIESNELLANDNGATTRDTREKSGAGQENQRLEPVATDYRTEE